MAIEVRDTRGNAAPPPRRRAAARKSQPVAAELEPSPQVCEPPPEPAEKPAPGSVFSRPAPRRRRTPAPAAAAEPEPAAAVRPEPVTAEPEPVAPETQPVAAAPEPVAPAPAGPPSPPAEVQAVVVRLAGTRFAVEMDAVAEVGRPPRVTRVPGVPAWLAGVVNWRGRVLAVLDLRPLLGAPQAPLGATGRVVVLSRRGVTVGLLADRVDGVAPLDLGTAEPALPTLSPTAATLVGAQLTDGTGPLAVLDLDTVFGLSDQLPRVRRAG